MQKLHEAQKARRRKNVYDHHMSRKGYAGLYAELVFTSVNFNILGNDILPLQLTNTYTCFASLKPCPRRKLIEQHFGSKGAKLKRGHSKMFGLRRPLTKLYVPYICPVSLM